MGIDNGSLVSEEDEPIEETYTYEVTLSVATCYLNSEITETISVWDELGLSDQEWDEMKDWEQDDAVRERLNDWVWENIDTGWEFAD